MPDYEKSLNIFRSLYGQHCIAPIALMPMAWIGTHELAKAALENNIAACLGIGNGNLEYANNQIESLSQAVPDKFFGVNILNTNSFKKELADLITESKKQGINIGFVILSAFLKPRGAKDIIEMLHLVNIKVIARIGDPRFIKLWAKENIDGIDVEGRESGGHLGPNYLEDILESSVEEASRYDLYVTGSGGIYDSNDLIKMLEQGAIGAGIGSRFAVSRESIAHENYKKAVEKATGKNCTNVAGESIKHPVRALVNPFSTDLMALEEKLLKEVNNSKITDEERRKKIMDYGTGAMKIGLIDGDIKKGSLMIGEIAEKIKKANEPISTIIDDLIKNTPYYESLQKSLLP